MKRLFLALLFVAVPLFGADIADPNAFARTVGTHVGVQGGIPTTRTNIINVVTSYNASGSDAETTGTITSGTNALSVASATGWSTGMGITVGRKAVLTMTITGAASAGAFNVRLPMNDPAVEGETHYRAYTFTFAGGESASTVASTVRAYSEYTGWTVSGSGTDCVFTATHVNPRPVGTNDGAANVTTSWAITTAGIYAFSGTVTAISGTDFTLSGNATASVTGGTVAHRDDLAIQAAIAASSANDIIYLPAGTYILNADLSFNNYSNRTLRGSGITTTILDQRYSTLGMGAQQTGDYAWARQQYALPAPSADNLVTAGLTAGSETITIGDTTDFDVGQTIQIAIDNQYDDTELANGAVFTYSVFGYNTLRRPMHVVVSKTSTVLTITPPIYFTKDSNLDAHVNHQRATVSGVGFEDFKLTGLSGPMKYGVRWYQAKNSWMKNVHIVGPLNYPVETYDSMFLEFRKCIIEGAGRAGSNGAGFLLNHVGASLVEDNQVYNIQPPVEINFSSVGNVIGYNLFNSPDYPNLVTNHGPHNSHNLFEGNITVGIISDGYFGGSSNETFYRNWSSGTFFEGPNYWGPWYLNRFTRYNAIIGNIAGTLNNPYVDPDDAYEFGSPPGGYSPESGVSPIGAGTFWPQWNNIAELTTRTSDTAGVLTITSGSGTINLAQLDPYLMIAQPLSDPHTSFAFNATAQTGSEITFTGYGGTLPSTGATFRLYFGHQNWGMRNVDHDAKPTWWPTTPGTTTVVANYNAASGNESIPANQALGANTLSDSYYTTKAEMEARGVVWGNLTFPPFDPTNPGDVTATGRARIPAGYRYLNAEADPPSGSNGLTINGTLTVNGTIVLP